MGTSTTHYALRTHGPHHHAVCRVCGNTFELPDSLFNPMVETLNHDYDFIADANHMVVMGWCNTCHPGASDE